MIKVHSYESMGTYDGPGLWLVVFLQGCPFRCRYCANPDTITLEGGTETDPSEIVKIAVSQKPFFGKKGGVTFSGGEPTVQAEALVPLVRELHENGINVCIDTNGGVWNRHVEELFETADLVLLDVKQFNAAKHMELTGRPNTRTLETARWLEEHGKPFWLRYVLVPGISDAEEDIRALGEHFGHKKGSGSGEGGSGYRMIRRVEILPYHTLGVNKYETLGIEYGLKDVPLNTPEQLRKAKELFDEYFDCAVLN